MAMNRRDFLALAAGSMASVAASGCDNLLDPFSGGGSPRLHARPRAPSETITPGMHPLGLPEDRDSFIYVPAIYEPNIPAPLLVLLHGGGGRSAAEWAAAPIPTLVDDAGLIVMAPSARGLTWDRVQGDWGPDVQFMDFALTTTFKRCNVDPTRIALGGFSDGGSYALSLGASNGDLFSSLLGFSPGIYAPEDARGRPRVFISHGTLDDIIPIDLGGRRIAEAMRRQGYDVTYREFNAGHTVLFTTLVEAVHWIVHPEAGG
jgi:phospholipase/carboxylesterase